MIFYIQTKERCRLYNILYEKLRKGIEYVKRSKSSGHRKHQAHLQKKKQAPDHRREPAFSQSGCGLAAGTTGQSATALIKTPSGE